jgi:hypothetical protein
MVKNKGSMTLFCDPCLRKKSNKIYEIDLFHYDIDQFIANKIIFPSMMKKQSFHFQFQTFSKNNNCFIYDKDASIIKMKNIIKQVKLIDEKNFFIQSMNVWKTDQKFYFFALGCEEQLQNSRNKRVSFDLICCS